MIGPDAHVVKDLAHKTRSVLAGHHPANQGAALADLLAIWLAGHPPGLREDLLRLHIEMVREMIPFNAAAMGTGV